MQTFQIPRIGQLVKVDDFNAFMLIEEGPDEVAAYETGSACNEHGLQVKSGQRSMPVSQPDNFVCSRNSALRMWRKIYQRMEGVSTQNFVQERLPADADRLAGPSITSAESGTSLTGVSRAILLFDEPILNTSSKHRFQERSPVLNYEYHEYAPFASFSISSYSYA